jgi:hypothetical protein
MEMYDDLAASEPRRNQEKRITQKRDPRSCNRDVTQVRPSSNERKYERGCMP